MTEWKCGLWIFWELYKSSQVGKLKDACACFSCAPGWEVCVTTFEAGAVLCKVISSLAELDLGRGVCPSV